jgi:hypothetical protein
VGFPERLTTSSNYFSLILSRARLLSFPGETDLSAAACTRCECC